MTADSGTRDVQVDVVIPLFNKAGVINRAVQSVLAQTYPHWTLVIVDDGSTDDWAVDVVDPRIVVVHQQNAGPGAARNTGAARHDGRYIAFLDADDEWLPNYLEHLVGVLEADSSLAAASSSWFRGSETDDVNAKFAARGVHEGRWELDPAAPAREFKMRVDSLHSSATIVQRDVFEALGGFYEKRAMFGEDSYLWTAVALTKPVFRSGEPLLRFHIDASSLSTGRTTPYPLPPIMTDPEALRAATVGTWEAYMPKYLEYYVPLILGRAIDEGIGGQAFAYVSGDRLRALGLRPRVRWSIRARTLNTAMKTTARRRLRPASPAPQGAIR
ncbi:glycosyltransferase family A protein [Microbacterium pumilum]